MELWITEVTVHDAGKLRYVLATGDQGAHMYKAFLGYEVKRMVYTRLMMHRDLTKYDEKV